MEAQLSDPDAIIAHLRSRANAGRSRHVWRQKFGHRDQRPNEALDDWLCDLRDIARKCEFSADCCTNCEATRILGQIIRGVNQDDLQCKLLEKGDSITLDSAIALLRNTEAAAKQSSNLKT